MTTPNTTSTAPSTQTYGELQLYYSNQNLQLGWSTEGVPGGADASFYNPDMSQLPPGFLPFGSSVVAGGEDNWSVLCVAMVPGQSGAPALANPIDFDEVWCSVGCDGNQDASLWQPIPPPGYVAMGDTFLINERNWGEKPATTSVWCLREDLALADALPNQINQVWSTEGMQSDQDLIVYSYVTADNDGTPDTNSIIVSAGSFIGIQDAPMPLVYAMQLPLM